MSPGLGICLKVVNLLGLIFVLICQPRLGAFTGIQRKIEGRGRGGVISPYMVKNVVPSLFKEEIGRFAAIEQRKLIKGKSGSALEATYRFCC